MTAFDALLRQAFVVCAVLALPPVIAATLVGTAVGIVQAATQVHEQTISLLPKMIAVGILAAFFGAAAMRLCGELFAAGLTSIPALVRGG